MSINRMCYCGFSAILSPRKSGYFATNEGSKSMRGKGKQRTKGKSEATKIYKVKKEGKREGKKEYEESYNNWTRGDL